MLFQKKKNVCNTNTNTLLFTLLLYSKTKKNKISIDKTIYKKVIQWGQWKIIHSRGNLML